MLIIVGGAGSGKKTVLKALEEKGYQRVVTYTTRQARENEVDGIDYNFITNERFCQLERRNFFAETSHYEASFGTCRYGSARYSYENQDAMIALDNNGVRSIRKANNAKIANAFVVYLHVSEKLLEQRLRARGDSRSEIVQRMRHDREALLDIEEYCDLVIHIDQETTIEDVVSEIERHSSEWKSE